MLEALYLNDNQLFGEIAVSIGELMSLTVCNLSNDNLVGTLPNTPAFQKMDSSNFAGNYGLCGLNVSHCHPLSPSWVKEGSSKEKLVSIISVTVGLMSLFFYCGCLLAYKRPPACIGFT